MELDILKKFNLPSTLKNKSFAEASKSINDKFKDRNDKHSQETKNELLKRLADAQEYLKRELGISNSDQKAMGGDISLAGATGMVSSGVDMLSPLIDDDEISSTLSNTAKGAAAGAAAGPMGALIGGTLGLGSSLIMGNKQKEQMENQKLRSAQAANSVHDSDFTYGGNLMRTYGTPKSNSPLKKIPTETLPVNLNIAPPINKQIKSSLEGLEKISTDSSNTNSNIGKGIKLPNIGLDALRYAPIGFNALQLANLDKPKYESLDRLDNRYKKDLVDEAALSDRVQQQTDNIINALSNSGTGSVGALRSNLLGAQVNANKALSNAILNAENINRQENIREQQFNLGVDRANLAQDRIENEINARNEGIYDTNKSNLISQLGTDIGNIGKEARYRQMITEMGLCYDSRGAYICGTEDRVPEEVVKDYEQERRYGGQVIDYYDVKRSKK